MELVRYHIQTKSEHSHRMAIIVKEGRKFMRIALLGETRLKKVPLNERRYMKDQGEVSRKHIHMFNRAARRFGYHKKQPLIPLP